ncbi:uncharacterized protein LOC109831254 [Asparagus officinalis]|uniref:uncharacterized protein LOC109831254 n=1 Tax=Asparagus officinalis TaxID=4686 RepID=UPI00098E0516|nr:uncharacterized protein LOC109831254 [Asparagus officinalis]
MNDKPKRDIDGQIDNFVQVTSILSRSSIAVSGNSVIHQGWKLICPTVQKLYSCVRKFSDSSGLEANLSKCSIFYGGVENSVKEEINHLLSFPEGKLPIKYLGLPLITKRLSYLDCSPLFKKITGQFQIWLKHSNLSYAGRLHIIKSVILGVQIYWTSCYLLPVKVLQKIDALCREFLWGKNDHKAKIPLVSWDKVCMGKNHGGLGIFSAAKWNMASALRSIWYIHTDKELLWIKWIHGTYLRSSDIWQVSAKTGDSWLWKQLLKLRDKAVSLCGGIINLKQCLNSSYRNSKIQLSLLYANLPPSSNKVTWYETVWERLNPPRQSFILWLAIQNKLLTKDMLANRGLLQSVHCVLCEGACLESRNHLFFDCVFSNEVWNGIMNWLQFNWRPCDWILITNWFSDRLKGNRFKLKVRRMALAAIVYNIWRERNARIFQSKNRCTDQIIRDVKIDMLSTILNSRLTEEHREWFFC